MNQYFHSISIDTEKCDGRMKCLRVCPTQAIRIRNGKAIILEEKCIDCGECITACPNGAIVAMTDPLGERSKFKYTVAIPSPTLYAQFGRSILPDKILAGLKKIGFDDAHDLAITCGDTSLAIEHFLDEYNGPKPLISNCCPSVVNLIQVRYPQLVDHIIPIKLPKRLAAREIKKEKAKELGLKPEDIGTFYITPCPVKMIAIKQPSSEEECYIDGVISIADIYAPLLSALESEDEGDYRKSLESVCILGIGWAVAGGMHRTQKLKNILDVSGITEIIKTFDDIERGKLQNIDLVVAYTCPQGCVGGSLTVENRYISYNKIIRLLETLEEENIEACRDKREIRERYHQKYFHLQQKYEPRPIRALDEDLGKAIEKRNKKERIFDSLPKIDCGICGAPTCLSFAEDVVRGDTRLSDCIFNVPSRFKELTGELSLLMDTFDSMREDKGQKPKKERRRENL
ncbi:MAG: [Fe-Fe] hydrogenase large subunit C-terminal domain-containing protein [candidate division Zixibacteria bacterium]|nr:[Fe-Fe] hydrogenase large subunit C-terminal domain-containing protein [candidate division Zixibacteria bacterium]